MEKKIRQVAVCMALVMVLMAFLPSPAAADGITATMSGRWIVDAPATEALWKKLSLDGEKEYLEAMALEYRVDVDFAASTIREGLEYRGDLGECPYSFTLGIEGKQLRMDVTGDNAYTFIWAIRDDGSVVQTFPGHDTPPMVLVPDAMLAYSGEWKIADTSPILEGAARRGYTPTEKDLEEIASLRLILDFEKEDVLWMAGEDEISIGPYGRYTGVERRKDGCTLLFRGKETLALTVVDADRIRVVIPMQTAPLEFVRMNGALSK